MTTLSLPPELTQAEIDEICEPLTQGAAQMRYLQSLGVTVDRKPNGRPLVNRQRYNLERGRSAAPAAADGPRWSV